MKAARAATIEVHTAKRKYKRKLAMNIDTDRKSFYAYVHSRSSIHRTVGPLVNDNGNAVVTTHELAEKFNSYFASVFTVEDMLTLPSANSVSNDD